MVVLAIFNNSSLNYSSLDVDFLAMLLKTVNALVLASLHPSIIIRGWIFYKNNFSACLKSSPAKTHTVVVPSPTSWS